MNFSTERGERICLLYRDSTPGRARSIITRVNRAEGQDVRGSEKVSRPAAVRSHLTGPPSGGLRGLVLERIHLRGQCLREPRDG